MTSATAIVSPIARPSPNIAAPIRPLRTRGNTATRNISMRVAPIAIAPFLSSWLTVMSASRDSDVMIGMIMIARMSPAVMNDAPRAGPPNRELESGNAADRVGDVRVEVRRRAKRAPRAPSSRTRPTGSRRGCRRRRSPPVRQPRGASSVMKSAMPRLAGTARTSAIVALSKRAVDEVERTEAVGVRIPVPPGDEGDALVRERGPRLAGGGVRDEGEDREHEQAGGDGDPTKRAIDPGAAGCARYWFAVAEIARRCECGHAVVQVTTAS